MSNDSKLFKANKDFGQHFLKDQNIINKICQDFCGEFDFLFEIGPGPGVLTENLKSINKPFFVVEIDGKFISHLEEMLGKENVIHEDALKVDLPKAFARHYSNLDQKRNIWCVSNLPYNISAPLISKLVKTSQVSLMTLMMQKEVAEKILPPQNLKNPMNSLLCLTQTFFQVSKLAAVPPGAFNPPPKVQSTVLSFRRRNNSEIPREILQNQEKFEKFLRVFFSERRKQLGTVLKKSFDKERISNSFSSLGIDTTRRSETLSLQDVQSLFLSLSF